MYWFLKAMKNYAKFAGRARRREFWLFNLGNVGISSVLHFAGRVDAVHVPASDIATVYAYVMLLPTLAVGARRLHDTGRSGWWGIALVVPVLGLIWLLVTFATEGDLGYNAYGPNPKPLPLA